MPRPDIIEAKKFAKNMLDTKLSKLGLDDEYYEQLAMAAVNPVPSLEELREWNPETKKWVDLNSSEQALVVDKEDMTIRHWLGLLSMDELNDIYADEHHRYIAKNDPIASQHYRSAIEQVDERSLHILGMKRALEGHHRFMDALDEFTTSGTKPSRQVFMDELALMETLASHCIDQSIRMQNYKYSDDLEEAQLMGRVSLAAFRITGMEDPIPEYIQGTDRERLARLADEWRKSSDDEDQKSLLKQIRDIMRPYVKTHDPVTEKDRAHGAEILETMHVNEFDKSNLCLYMGRQIRALADKLDMSLSSGRERSGDED